MYVANQLTSSWLLNVQRTLFARSKDNLDYVFCKLWGLVVDLRNLQIALARVAGNRGHRTAGVDGVTVRMIARDGIEGFLEGVRSELRSGDYLPSPVRRVLIPKPGQLGKFRALGIPTVKDRVVQAALKNILEPVFEADFYPSSYGFRPGRSAHGALEQLRLYLRPCKAGSGDHRRLTYQWAIQGDIKACFDRIDHHALMEQVRRRVGDPKVNRLVLSFLKAGIVSEQQFVRSDAGTPQGGILSPLLANIALAVLDERYERWVWPRRSVRPAQAAKPFEASSILAAAKYARRTDRLRRKTPVLVSVRYADDFIILVAAPTGPEQFERARDVAIKEKAELAAMLKSRLGLELSEEKTLVTPVTERMPFLGHHVCVRRHPVTHEMVSTSVIPKRASHRLRERIKDLFRAYTKSRSLADRLRKLNWLLQGWSNFYRHAWGAKRVFAFIDHYVWWTTWRWLRKKHRRAPAATLARRYGRRGPRGGTTWVDEDTRAFLVARRRVEPYRMAWMRPPAFAINTHGEPDA
jgi:RNA-directed DNA polymerase